MGTAIDRAVIIRLLADPHAVRDLRDHRAAYRAMGAEILPGGDGCADGRRRACLCLPYTGKRYAAERRQASGGET